jgi:hypothetical protein
VVNPTRVGLYSEQKAQLYEVMESLCMFSGQARLSGVNPQLFDKLCEPIGLNANDTRDSSNSAGKMELFYSNLKGSTVFEDALLRLIGLEMSSVVQHSGSTLDQTASFKLVSEIMLLL